MNYKKVVLVGILSVGLLVGLLVGCLDAQPEQELYVDFENAANQEKTLFDNTKTLEQLETRSQELYNQIMQEGKEHNEAVIPKIEQAILNVDEREKLLKLEKDVLEKSQKKVASVRDYINKIEDKKLQTQAKRVEESYRNRYEAFQKMNEKYTKSFKVEKELYGKLKDKEIKLKEINETVTSVNMLNEEILKEKEKFNQYTKDYNEGKLTFYKAAKIKIKE
ncbi:hypothetical protein CN404_24500 [Bacillus thuringiensis]|uniref:YkyA family protein n=1 Tax=Bacillus thuringiensis TaxID=1428 RepID=UPI000BF893AA|nr:YkyA family protein [Bacillus thuringiensis]PFB51623.1 hypothetical protein CN404_24500 [Bacillus thuringiensis]